MTDTGIDDSRALMALKDVLRPNGHALLYDDIAVVFRYDGISETHRTPITCGGYCNKHKRPHAEYYNS